MKTRMIPPHLHLDKYVRLEKAVREMRKAGESVRARIPMPEMFSDRLKSAQQTSTEVDSILKEFDEAAEKPIVKFSKEWWETPPSTTGAICYMLIILVILGLTGRMIYQYIVSTN